MPAHVQDLLVEIDLVGIGFLAHPLCPGRAACSGAILLAAIRSGTRRRVDRSWHAHFLSLERRFVGLQDDLYLLLRVRRVNHEVVVVAARHDILRIARKDNLELVEYTVVLIGIAQTWSQVLVDRDGLDRLPLHVDVPNLDGQVISGEDVSAVVRESDVRDG